MSTMKTLEKGQDKIKKISEQLRSEILEPAKEEAKKIIQEAEQKADHIIEEAEKHVETLIQAGRKTLEQERHVFHSSLQQASKQSLEALKQAIEHNLFNDQLNTLLNQSTINPRVIADLIAALIKAIEKEGLAGDLSVVVPHTVSTQEVNDLLADGILKRLKDQSVVVGDFKGGVRIKFIDKSLTIDMSDETLKDLISRYVRKDFRKFFFGS